MNSDYPKTARIGPILLAPGVTAREVVAFLTVAAITGSVVAFVALIQPFVLSELIGVPTDQQGWATGTLTTLQQVVLMVTVGFTGALGDRLGRRVLLVSALVGFALCLLGMSFAPTLAALFAIRLCYGLASSLHTASVPPKLVDYPQEASRGKFMAMAMVAINLATMVLVGYVAAHLPGWFRNTGLNAAEAGRAAIWTVAAVSILLAFVAWRFMAADRPVAPAGDAPGLTAFRAWGEVFRHARDNPRFGLLVITGLVIRTDEAVLLAFLALWVTVGAKAEGIGAIEAIQIAGVLTMIKTGALLVVPMILGPIIDRVDRAWAYVIAVTVAGLALMSTIFVDSISGPGIYIVMLVIGVAEAAQYLTQQALFGQEAPPRLRGTAYGMLAVLGTLSVVFVSIVGGRLFDTMGPAAPFILSGAAHLLALLPCLVIWLRRRRQA